MADAKPESAYVTTKECMAMFHVSRVTILAWAAKGILKAWNPSGIVNAKKLYKISDNPIIMEAMESIKCKKVRRGS